MRMEFKRDLYHNYLVIVGETSFAENYELKMMTYNHLHGFLPIQIKYIDGFMNLYYDISSMQPFSTLYEKTVLKRDVLVGFISGLLGAVEQGKEYMLREEGFLFEPDYIFMNPTTQEISLCYIPGYKNEWENQLTKLMEMILDRVDYQDEQAVRLAYALYKCNKEKNSHIQTMRQILAEDSKKEKEISLDRLKSTTELSGLKEGNGGNSIVQSDESENVGKSDSPRKRLSLNAYSYTKGKQHAGPSDTIDFKKQSKFENSYKWLSQVTQSVSGIWNRSNQSKGITKEGSIVKGQKNKDETTAYYDEERCAYKPANIILCGISLGFGFLMIYILAQIGWFQNRLDGTLQIPKIVTVLAAVTLLEYSLFRYLLSDKQKVLTVKTLEDRHIDREYLENKTTEEGKKKLGDSFLKYNRVIEDEPENTVLLSEQDQTGLIQYVLQSSDPLLYEDIYLTEFPFFIGKLKTKVDHVIKCTGVSRFHAKVICEDNQYYLVDLNSTNGTYVNDRLLRPNEKSMLAPGDQVCFAESKFVFHSIMQ